MRNKSVGVGVANISSIVEDVIKFIIVVIMMSEQFEVIFYGDVINCVRDETGKEYNLQELISILMDQQATITKLEQICEKKMQEIENIKYSLKEIAYKYHKEVQFKADTDPNQAVKEVLGEQQATIEQLQEELELTAKNKLFSRRKLEEENKQLKKENEKLGNIHLSIDLTYSCGYGRYLADVRVIDDE